MHLRRSLHARADERRQVLGSAFQIGQPLEGGAIGRVIASQNEKLPVGSYVQSIYGWREALVAPAANLQIFDTTVSPASAYLGILGVKRF